MNPTTTAGTTTASTSTTSTFTTSTSTTSTSTTPAVTQRAWTPAVHSNSGATPQNATQINVYLASAQQSTAPIQPLMHSTIHPTDVKIHRSGLLSKAKQFAAQAAPHYVRGQMPTDPQVLMHVGTEMKLAKFPYNREKHDLPPGWDVSSNLADPIRSSLNLTSQGVGRPDGAIVDMESGLVACILVNVTTKELVVSFGGTNSGEEVRGDGNQFKSRFGKNFMTSLSQWKTNFSAGVGKEPVSYMQAVMIVDTVQDAADIGKNGPFSGYTVRTVGHSKGGGEAAYAALNRQIPLQSTGFCSAHLSQGLIDRINETNPNNLNSAPALVQTFSPFKDPVSGLRNLLPNLPGVGTGYHFNGDETESLITFHAKVDMHFSFFQENIDVFSRSMEQSRSSSGM